MTFTFYHNNINVANLDASLAFYQTALGLTVTKEQVADDESFRLVFLGDNTTQHLLELTWLQDMDTSYNLGDNEFHLAMKTDNMEESLSFHKAMNCVCYENIEMGIYFISDPDGYWIEICPVD